MKCDVCDGTGYIETHDCWGKTEKDVCFRCNGKGHITFKKTCTVCNGLGEYKTHDCWGKTEWVDCQYCGGTGKI